ncbi:SDR family oxidoreductase [Rhizobium sp. CCGE 510]|uniref:SDR family NAD(P)-dependent oxidoreductase n=1 Tax=Rhizobium sp. CCGE 510 TaxID=1132836 RepID=UPI00027B80CD|nr:SDR family oxidoreductase [Rhizobium sp. CCGE 510]EJT06238.1 short-chain dehydrogenase/reductase SDR [Rhizobium sp. CCGE 510]
MMHAVVTGGASGIGEATARLLSRNGAHVTLIDVNGKRGARIAGEINADGGKAAFHQLDVSNEKDLLALAAALFAERPVDVLVNSAGILQNAVRLNDMDLGEFDRIIDVNLKGTVLVCRAFGSRMCAAGAGSIVNLCSLTSLTPSPQLAYGMSKAAVKMLTESLAAELGPSNVRVNAVAPGYTLTPAMQQRIDEGARNPAKMIEAAALRRLVSMEDVAEAINFLSSDKASAITGVVIPVDCGFLVGSAYNAYAAQP